MLFGQPDWWGSRWRRQHHLDAGFAHDVHHATEPAKIRLLRFRFADAPDELSHARDIHAGLRHQLSIPLPRRFGIFGSAAVRVNPLFRMIINTEIHKLCAFVCGRFPTLQTSPSARNRKVFRETGWSKLKSWTTSVESFNARAAPAASRFRKDRCAITGHGALI